MSAKEIITIQISINGKKLIFDKNNYKSPVDFNTEDDDSDDQNVRIELGIAKVFHKVLNFIKTDSDLFQKQDFELLGEMLAKIIFGKQGDPRGGFMIDTLHFIRAGVAKNCRIILSFDGNSNLANLPWEYVLYKFRDINENYYLSASVKSNFQIMRRFPVKVQNCVHGDEEKLFVILLLNVEGNSNANPKINSMSTEIPLIQELISSLKKLSQDKIEFEILDGCSMEDVKEKVEKIVTGWKNKYGHEPAYVLHYVGHSILDMQIGKLVMKPKQDQPVDWVKDRVFASLFGADMLDVRQPTLVFFLACNSAKIGVIDNVLRGVAYEFTRMNIPAVVGMQNDINTIQSCAFFYKVYESLLNGEDISEAVTKGRDHLGTDHKDFCGQELQPLGETYKNNYFGSPVLFITTDEPVKMIKSEVTINKDQKEKVTESDNQLHIANLGSVASKITEHDTGNVLRDKLKADDLQNKAGGSGFK